MIKIACAVMFMLEKRNADLRKLLESCSVAQPINDTGHNINIRNLKLKKSVPSLKEVDSYKTIYRMWHLSVGGLLQLTI